MKVFHFFGFVILVSVFISKTSFADAPICDQLNKVIAKGKPAEKLNHFLALQWTYLMHEAPEWATYVGEPGQNDRLSDMSLEAIARRKKETVCQLEVLKKISSLGLKGEDKINYELAQRNLEVAVEGQKFDSEYLVLDQLGGPHQALADLLNAMPTANLKDYLNMIARLDLFPAFVDQDEILLREGLKRKVTAVRQFLAAVPPQIDHLVTENVDDSPLYQVFKNMGPNFSESEKQNVQRLAKESLKTRVYPRLQKFKKFVVEEYIPGARESIAQTDLPNGKAWYAYNVKTQTTTDLTPDQLHELGLKEVERISEEMKKLRDQMHYKGSAEDFNKFLLTDSQFYYTNKEDLLSGYRSIAKKIDPELPKLFKELPRLTYGVREMPEYKAKESPGAYYEEGSISAGRAGFFTANTYDLKARPKWSMEALTMHESVPGHHLQIAIGQEVKGLPKFRTEAGYTAFVEGWGLYAERLGEEMGFYKDPYSKYGELTYEMWRAVRLVVDTGMHAKSWSRQKAIDFMKSRLPKSQLEVEVEIDLYVTWPGQALAYKVGQLKFLELRARAQAALGDKFNVRDFHDEVLRHGALPMDVLEKVMTEWMDSQKKRIL